MDRLFQRFMQLYLADDDRLVNKEKEYYRILHHDIPNAIRRVIGSEYMVKASCGQGNKTKYPWIGIFDGQLAKSAQKGLYVVYLFRSDLKGFYLSLHQGFTHFQEQFGRSKYLAITKVADAFRDKLDSLTFSQAPIDLGSNKGDLGYGYEHANIMSKHYSANALSTEELSSDLEEMMGLFESIKSVISSQQEYERFVKSVHSGKDLSFLSADEADDVIKKNILAASKQEEIDITSVEEVPIPTRKGRRSIYKKSTEKVKKTDYLAKAEQDLETGVLGERLVIHIEKQRLRELGRDDLAQSVQWVAQERDDLGYDVLSYHIDDAGDEYPVYIEVKASTLRHDGPFYVSHNELETSKRYADNYWLYRVYAIASSRPKYYIAIGDLEKHFQVEPQSYIVYN